MIRTQNERCPMTVTRTIRRLRNALLEQVGGAGHTVVDLLGRHRGDLDHAGGTLSIR